MATTIPNSTAAFGGDRVADAPKAIEIYQADGAIAAKTVVVVTDAGKVSQAATGSTKVRQLGIALQAASDGQPVPVCVRGLVKAVNAQGAISDNGPVSRSGTTAGYVAAEAGTTPGEIIGFAIGAAAGGLVNLYVQKV